MKRKITYPLHLAGLLLLTILLAAPPTTSASDPSVDDQVYSMIVRSVGQTVAGDAARIFGTDSPQYCIVTRDLALCIHPDTPPERVDEILRGLPTWSGDKYQLGQRWSTTATDGDVGLNSPINLTYSFLDDGVWIPGASEPGSGSRLYQVMNDHFGNETVWKAIFASIFNDWGKQIGVSYQEVEDDGAAFPNSPGELGLRGDVRIGSHAIDGSYGVLAYNFFPNFGDMVLDSAEYWSAASNNFLFMRNICRHEHGHGIGLQHVAPNTCQKLMEPFICTNFDGPQDDDVRGGMRFYGDTFEFNNTASSATDLGTLVGVFSPEFPVSLTTSVDYDYFRFTTLGAAVLNVIIDPVGGRYDLEGVMVQTDEVMDLAFRVLGGSGGSDVLIHVDETGLGDNEVLVDFTLPAAGDYWVLVFRAAGLPDVQRYDLTIDVEPSDITAVDYDRIPRVDLGLRLFPNPFNPRTTARFYVGVPGPVVLDVYDVAGKLVRSIVDRAESVGWADLTWDGRNNSGESVPSGAYLVRVQVGNKVQNVRGLLLE